MTYSTLLLENRDGLATVTVNRPDKLNALNDTVISELGELAGQIATDDAIRAVILTGAGAKAFVAGADIGELAECDSARAFALSQKGSQTFRRLERSEKPIIAAVNGFALGGGCELAMACHFRVASENAKFGQPEVNLGLIPGYGGTQRLTQLIGKGRAIEFLISGNMIDARTALQYGLVNYVVRAEELLSKCITILEVINSKAPVAVGQCIRCVNAVFDESVNGYEKEITAFGDCFVTNDMKEGTSAFLEKRKAVFTGK